MRELHKVSSWISTGRIRCPACAEPTEKETCTRSTIRLEIGPQKQKPQKEISLALYKLSLLPTLPLLFFIAPLTVPVPPSVTGEQIALGIQIFLERLNI